MDSRTLSGHCPRCGTYNHCAVAADRAPATCWCHSARIAGECLEDIPASQRDRCICPRCAQASHQHARNSK